MELKKYTAQIKVWIEKYKYVILVLLIGIVLMCVPFNASDHNDNIDAKQRNLDHTV